MISEAAKKGKGNSKLGGLIPSYAARTSRSSAASTASESTTQSIPVRSASSRPKPRPVTKPQYNLDSDSETESFIKHQPSLYKVKTETIDNSAGGAKFVYGGISDDEKAVPAPAGLPSQQVNPQCVIFHMLLTSSASGGCQN
jgi:hypothetical protein